MTTVRLSVGACQWGRTLDESQVHELAPAILDLVRSLQFVAPVMTVDELMEAK